MSNLDKDQVLADFTAAYTTKFGKEPQIEQKPGWYSVDGGKNMRLAELAELGESYGNNSAKKAVEKTESKPKAKAAKPATKKRAAPADKAGAGQPGAVWSDRVNANGKQRMPRGYR